MSESRAPALAAVSLAAVFGLTGCNTNPNINAAVGAAAGAAAGAILGGSTGGYPPSYYGSRPGYYNPPPVCRQIPITRPDRYGYPQTNYVTRCEP